LKVKSYRLLKADYCSRKELGEGARLYGGRWNSKGTSLIYTSQHLSLCNLEMITATAIYPKDIFVYLEFEFEVDEVQIIPKKNLVEGWNAFPHKRETQYYGDKWVAMKKALVLKVPSSLVKTEFNYLINPSHVRFSKVKVSKPQVFRFNNRFSI